MAHFARPLALAASLDPDEYSVSFYAPERYYPYLAGVNFAVGPLQTLPTEQFLANLAKGAPLFSGDTVRRYVSEDLQVIQQVKPDLVIGDLRLSLPISARLKKARFATVMNAYWSPWRARPRIIPEIPLTRVIAPRFVNLVYRFLEPVVSRIHVGQMNRVRAENGIPPLLPDFGRMYMDADFVLYPDVPEFVALPAVPSNHYFLGICDWSPPGPRPPWWDQMLADPRPKILIALGSSGPMSRLPHVISAVNQFNFALVIATSGRAVQTPSDSYVAELLPLADILKIADLVISHGGSPLVYPALAAGCPTLAIPSNADQHLSADLLVKSGAGLSLRSEEATVSRLQDRIRKLLEDVHFRTSAREWRARSAQYDFKALFNAFVRRATA